MSNLHDEVRRRRTFAIISHPDAGKTTLTEKLLLYGGAIHLAGSVKARRTARHATSDWMQMEQERGISVTSSVLQFEYQGRAINLLDTPGHQDFSEDTYRTLMAADSAVMLLDNRKGVEEQTRKLFEVCRLRKTPVFTFVNKCDRPGADPLQLLDDVERELGMRCYPVMWPITAGDKFLGVYDRAERRIYLFDRGEDHGQTRAGSRIGSLDDPGVREMLGEQAHDQLMNDIELLDMAGSEFSREEFLAGEVSPTFFGSALTNFGVEPFLQTFLELAPSPTPRQSSEGLVEPEDPAFTGFVFKIQANMDPKHRDRIAFVRVCSGRFEANMQVRHVRTGKPLRLAAPTQFLARERTHIEEAWAGDVIGIHDRGNLRIGDTLSANGELEFQGIPRFSPEHFARIFIADPMRRKQLDVGLQQLSEEGAAQVFYTESLTGPSPIVGAVGRLQFDVLLHRLEHEYGVPARLEPMSFRFARWVEGPLAEVERVATGGYGRALVYDSKHKPLILFDSEWTMKTTIDREKDLAFHDVAP
ncbi:MAG TPA: peptide chain release factor 3 [Longimicrobiaceae bacterium]|jgi:peptide chain release factor 3|nr:peptide chain release factor 3 [Longimicrobiaceae bacterium]